MDGKKVGAVLIGAVIAFVIYHTIFVLKPLDAVKSKINAIEKSVTAKADTVRRSLGAMKSGVDELNQRVSGIEAAQDAQKESITSINTALEEAKMVAVRADEKADRAIGLGKSRAKTKGVPEPTKGKGAKSRKSSPSPPPMAKGSDEITGKADSDTLLAKLLERQNELFEQVENINKRFDERERGSEPIEQSAESFEKEDSGEKSRARLSAKTGKAWKNSFAF